MEKKLLVSFALLTIGIALVILLASCDGKKVGAVTKDVSNITGNLAPHTAEPISSILYLVSSIAAAVSGVAFGAVKYQEARKMRKAIKGHSKAIDSAKYSPDGGVAKAARDTCAYIKGLAAANNPGIGDDIAHFNAIRKGYR